MPLAAHGVTHPGRRRSNEDSMLLDDGLGLFVVADGMGGHNAGEVASAIAVRTLHEFLRQESSTTEATLEEGIARANEEVFSASTTQPDYDGMGTTVVAAVADEERVLFASVGDSRIYLWRTGTLTQLTQDDSWVSRVLPEDVLSTEEAQRHPMRHVLTKVVGLREDLEPAVGTSPFARGDVLVMCSDGLHGAVSDDDIARTAGRSDTVETIAQHLVDQALRAGATDNVTVIVVRHD
jgi:PPM family protein phosphatase